jgi:hypothetical protein
MWWAIAALVQAVSFFGGMAYALVAWIRDKPGYEAMNIIRKGRIRWLPRDDVVGQKRFIERIFGIAA